MPIDSTVAETSRIITSAARTIKDTVVVVWPDSHSVHVLNQVDPSSSVWSSFWAAIIGAVVGGGFTLAGVLLAQRLERKRRNEERAAELDALRKRARRRIGVDLWQALRASGRMQEKKGQEPMPTLYAKQLLTIWKSYFEHRDDLVLLDNRAVEERLVDFYEECKILAKRAIAFEQKEDIARQANPSNYEQPWYKRQHIQVELEILDSKIRALLEELKIRNMFDY